MTNEPESDDVIKNTNTSTIPIKEIIPVSGRFANIWKVAKLTSVKPSSASEPTPCWICSSAAPPNALIHTAVITVGMSSTAMMNSRTVRPRETRAINMPTNGDQENHQAQENIVQPCIQTSSSRPNGLLKATTLVA